MTPVRWRAVSTILMLVVSATACSSTGDGESAARRLPDGLRVPPGSRLVGAVAPSILPSGDRTTGWTALLTIGDDPVGVFRDFTRQAARLGLGALPPVRTACQSDYRSPDASPGVPTGSATGTDVRCSGATDKGDNLAVTVAACSSCRPRVSAAELSYRSVPKRPIRRTELPTPVPRGPRSIPASSWPVLQGTRVLAQADLGQCQGSRYTVLEVTGSPDEVWDRYLARYGSSTAFEPVTKAVEATVDGARVRQSLGGATGQSEAVTLVQRHDLARPILSVDECSD